MASSALASSRTATLAPARRAGAPSTSSSPASSVAARAVPNKKALSYDDTWKKGFWGTGLFLEGNEARGGSNYLAKIEKKKLLSSVEKSGLLSQAEKAGLTLSFIEKSGLLSTAENLGLLEVAESALVTDPGKITAASIAPLVGTLLTLSLFPDDNAVLAVVKYSVAAVLGGAFLTLFAGGYLIAALQE